MIPVPALPTTSIFPTLPTQFVAGGVAFVAVVFITVLLFSETRRESLHDLVQTYSGNTDGEPRRGSMSSGSFWDRIALPILSALARVLSSTTPQRMRDQAGQKLAMAGNPVGTSTFLTFRGVCLFGLPLAYVVHNGVSEKPWGTQQFVILVVAVLVGRSLPDLLLTIRIRRRQKKIERSIPDAVDLIVACVEGGLSLDGALKKVSDRMAGPLTDEIARALHEISLGRPRRDALKDVAARTGVQSLHHFSQSIAHAEQMGVSIADVLRTLGDQLREKRKLRAQEMARKAPIKMIPVVIVFMLPALYVVVIGPAFLTILGYLVK